MSLRREVVARSKLPHMRRGLFWVQGSWSPEGHGDIPLLFCGSKRRVVIDRGRPWCPRGHFRTPGPYGPSCPTPWAHISQGPGRTGQQENRHWNTGLRAPGEGLCVLPGLVCGVAPPLISLSLLSGCLFLKPLFWDISYTIKFAKLKWFPVYSQSCAAITTV